MPTLKKTVHRPWQTKKAPQSGRIHSNTKFYQSTPWRNLREIKLKQQPLCEECLRSNIFRDAKVVDHIVSINSGGAALDINNLQSLCHTCHNRKSGREAHTR